jgi:voltage-gated potassium channel
MRHSVVMLSGLRLAALLFVAVSTVGVVGYHVLEDYSWLEALYMTVITLSTVGFGEVRPLHPVGRVFTILLLAGGLGVVFYTMVTVTERVVEGEFQQFFGRRRMQKRIGMLSNHYLVCGFGRIGEVVCRELASKPAPFVVIEQQEERIREAEANQYLVLQGDATEEKTLLAVGVRQARGLFAALATDAGNVFVTLTAKELNPALFVVARAETERSERTLLRSGADKVISPYAMGGHRMAQAALRPAVVDIIDLATHHQSLELQLEEIPVPVSSPCNGAALRDSGLWEQPGVMVVAIKRASGKMLFNPAPGEKIEAGDSLIALAETPQLKEIERRVRGGHE